tara:strand:+ start:206 stop:502 length:297 start_codon:yes stop_codon:yes gene_type:complete
MKFLSMKSLDDLRILIKSFFKSKKPNEREMKRVFQWERYLQWKDLSSEEQLATKRFFLIPIFAYLIIRIFNQNLLLIVLLLIGYSLYKKFEKGGIEKK